MDSIVHSDRCMIYRDSIRENIRLYSDENSLKFGPARGESFLYKKYERGTVDGNIFEIKFNDGLKGLWNGFKFYYHLSHFNSFYGFINALKKITREHFNHTYFDLPITRFDFAVDLRRDFDSLALSIHKSGSKVQRMYQSKSGMKSIYLGSMKNSHIKIYEKVGVSEFDCENDFRSNYQIRNGISCRIEQVLKGRDVPFKNLSDMVEKIWNYHFFKGVHFYHNDSTFEWIEDEKARLRVQSFLFMQSKVGYLEARKRFSRGGNFQRDVGQFLENKPVIDLEKMVVRRLERMFEVENVECEATKLELQ